MTKIGTKPWEDEWATDGETLYLRGEDHDRIRPFARIYEPIEDGDVWAQERAELAALAPRMARMLSDLEWSAGDDRADACPYCFAAAQTATDSSEHHGHAPSCKLQILLGEIRETAMGGEK